MAPASNAAGGAGNEERHQATALVGGDGVGERSRIHSVPLVDRHDAQRVGADSGNIHGLGDASMGGGRGVAREASIAAGDAALSNGRPADPRAGDQQPDQIGHRRPRDEEAAGRFRKSEQLARPPQYLPFDLKRDRVAPDAIGIESGRQHFGQHADGGAAALDPAHETGMRIGDGIRQNVSA